MKKILSWLERAWAKNWLARKFYYFSFIKLIEARIWREFLIAREGERICDIACGTGISTVELANKGCQVIGIDINKESIKVVKSVSSQKRCHFLVGKAESLPFKSGCFDKVICICSLEHFDDDLAALEEMNRVLKSGGLLILTVDSFTWLSQRSQRLKDIAKNLFHCVNFYSLNSLSEKLEAKGFQVEKARYFLNSSISAFFFELWVKLYFNKLLVKAFDIFFPITYGLSIFSEKMFGSKERGYQLAVKAKKIKSLL